ncbi:hypothetical protein ACP275_04G065800 [Erythranthe tilingii]
MPRRPRADKEQQTSGRLKDRNVTMSDRGKAKASHDARHHKSSNFVDDDIHSDRMDIVGEGPSSHTVDDEFEYPDIDEHHLFDDEPVDDPINDVAEGNGVPISSGVAPTISSNGILVHE